jgi:UDPglucose--hexose-1-phosphate uridylyltransferase
LPEIRQDAISGHWVIVAPERARRPHAFANERAQHGKAEPCPFCPGNEPETPPEVMAIRDHGQANEPGWRLRIVPNKFPALRRDALPAPPPDVGLRRTAAGAHEVVIETAEHDVTWSRLPIPRLSEVLEAIRTGMAALAGEPGVEYVFFFKNHGEAAGATLEHPHSQLLALPMVPALVAAELEGAERYYARTDRCYFCELAEDEAAGGDRLVLDCGPVAALAPYAARAPFEVWILPRRHQATLGEATPAEIEALARAIRGALRKLDEALGETAYNLFLHEAPQRSGPLRHYHWHFELIPRLARLAGFEWGAQMFINPIAPEEAARRLRESEAG